MTGCAVYLIPLRACQRYVCGFADIGQVVGIHRSRNQLHICRMAQDPRRRDPILDKSYFSPISANFALSSGKSSLSTKVPLKKPYWNGDHARIVIFLMRLYSKRPPSCIWDSAFFMFTFMPDVTIPDSVTEYCNWLTTSSCPTAVLSNSICIGL